MNKRNLSKERRLAKLNRIGELSRIQGEKVDPPAGPPTASYLAAHNIMAEAELTNVLKEENMQKLILDQPDRVTNEGTVETIIPNEIQLNEIETTKKKEVLITENPLDGIKIILND